MKKNIVLSIISLFVLLIAAQVSFAATEVEVHTYTSVNEMLADLHNKEKAQEPTNTVIQAVSQPIINVNPQPIIIYRSSSSHKSKDYYPNYNYYYDGFDGEYGDYLYDRHKEKKYVEKYFYFKYKKHKYKPYYYNSKYDYYGTYYYDKKGYGYYQKDFNKYDGQLYHDYYDMDDYMPHKKYYYDDPKVKYTYKRATYIKPTHYEEDPHHLTYAEYKYHYDQDYRDSIKHEKYHDKDVPHGHDY